MSIDSYIYFNQRLTNSLINEVINKINDDKNYKLDLISGPVKGSITSKSKIDLNFDFKYKDNETAKVLVSLFYNLEENKIEDICENGLDKYKDSFTTDVFTKSLVISAVPKDDASYVLFQLITKELVKELEGIALCYLIDKNEDEDIRFLSYKDIDKEINKNINSLTSNIFTVDNKDYVDDIISEWEVVSNNRTNTNKSLDYMSINYNFKYSIIYLIISIVFFLLIIICCPTEYITNAPVFYQRLSDISFVLLVLNVPVFIAPIVIKKIR